MIHIDTTTVSIAYHIIYSVLDKCLTLQLITIVYFNLIQTLNVHIQMETKSQTHLNQCNDLHIYTEMCTSNTCTSCKNAIIILKNPFTEGMLVAVYNSF